MFMMAIGSSEKGVWGRGRGKGTESNPTNTSAVIFGMLESVEVVMIFENAGKFL